MNICKKTNKKAGFTIIELIVVIAVIAVLAAVVISNVSKYNMKSRDARRVADLATIRKALDLFFIDNGYYPRPSAACNWDGNCYCFSTQTCWTDNTLANSLANQLAPYLPVLPKDPKNTGSGPFTTGNYTYSYGNVGRYNYTPKHQYDLTAQLEDTSNPLRCELRCWPTWMFGRSTCTSATCIGGYSNSTQIYEASPQ